MPRCMRQSPRDAHRGSGTHTQFSAPTGYNGTQSAPASPGTDTVAVDPDEARPKGWAAKTAITLPPSRSSSTRRHGVHQRNLPASGRFGPDWDHRGVGRITPNNSEVDRGDHRVRPRRRRARRRSGGSSDEPPSPRLLCRRSNSSLRRRRSEAPFAVATATTGSTPAASESPRTVAHLDGSIGSRSLSLAASATQR
jgi:hypothetical protein